MYEIYFYKFIFIKSIYDGCTKVLTENLSFRNWSFNNLNFESILFYNSVDLSDCSLVNAKFFYCSFTDGYHYLYDRTDLNNCSFEFCNDGNGYAITHIKDKVITFYDAKNFELAVFDEKVKVVIKETYNL